MLEKEEVKQIAEKRVADTATTEWALPTVLVSKGDGCLKFCVDYHCLIAITERDSNSNLWTDEYVVSLDEAKLFLTLDADSEYWQIKLDYENVDKTAFVTHDRLLCNTRIPFRLMSAPATFQREVEVILVSIMWQFAIVCIDYIIVFSQSPQQHLSHTEETDATGEFRYDTNIE